MPTDFVCWLFQQKHNLRLSLRFQCSQTWGLLHLPNPHRGKGLYRLDVILTRQPSKRLVRNVTVCRLSLVKSESETSGRLKIFPLTTAVRYIYYKQHQDCVLWGNRERNRRPYCWNQPARAPGQPPFQTVIASVRPAHRTTPAQRKDVQSRENEGYAIPVSGVTWSPPMAHLAILWTAHHRFLLRCIGYKRKPRHGYLIFSYADALAKTGCETTVRKWMISFAGFVARMCNARLSKRVMLRQLDSGKGYLEGQEQEWMGFLERDISLFIVLIEDKQWTLATNNGNAQVAQKC